MSGLLLAIDTTSEFGSIALLDQGRLLEEVAMHSAEGFSPVLFGELQALLARQAAQIGDIAVFAAASGPGSFTGVRVGLTAAKGLAYATNRKVVGVSNLRALAVFGSRELRATLIDARRGEIYGAVYDAQLQLVQAETVAPIENWLAQLPPGDVELITSGYRLPPGIAHPVIQAPQVLAAAVGRVGWMMYVAGQACMPEQVDANYVRRSDAEMAWRDRV